MNTESRGEDKRNKIITIVSSQGIHRELGCTENIGELLGRKYSIVNDQEATPPIPLPPGLWNSLHLCGTETRGRPVGAEWRD